MLSDDNPPIDVLDDLGRSAETEATEVLQTLAADAGIHIDGDNPWDIQVHDPGVYRRILTQGSLGFGEAYMDGVGCTGHGRAVHPAVALRYREQTRLPVRIELMDCCRLEGSYDKLVSVGMFEHVGPKNYPGYFDAALRLLKEDGLFLLHTIGIHAISRNVDP